LIDPRTRLLLVFVLSLLALTVKSLWSLLGVFVLSLLLALALRIELAALARRWVAFASIFLFVSVIQSLFRPGGDVLLGFGSVSVLTAPGLRLGFFGLLRLLTVLQGGLVLARVRTRDMTQAFQRIRLPAEIALAGALGAGFVPRLRDEFRGALENLRTRGIPLDELGLLDRLRVYGLVLSPVLGLVIRKARALADVLELRGFRAGGKRTHYRGLRLGPLDLILMGFGTLLLASGFLFSL
jgi:energy-coupling factor transporter transmembrane protein EcfT